jgi:N6-adenosine-specific RNA methylase IME4
MTHVEPTPASVIIERRGSGFEDLAPTCPGWWYHRPRGRETATRLVLVSQDLSSFRPEKGTASYAVEGDEGRWLGFGGPAGWPVSERQAALEAVNGPRMQVNDALTARASKLWRSATLEAFNARFGLAAHPNPPVVRMGSWEAMPVDSASKASTVYLGYAIVQGSRHCFLGPTVETARRELADIGMTTPPSPYRLDWRHVGAAVADREVAAARLAELAGRVTPELLQRAAVHGAVDMSSMARELGVNIADVGPVLDALVDAGRLERGTLGAFRVVPVDPQRINCAEPVSEPYKFDGAPENCDDESGKSEQFPPQLQEACGPGDEDAEVEPCDPQAPVWCEKCRWSGVEDDAWVDGSVGCVCPACGDMWSVTAGAPPRPALQLVERNVAPEPEPADAAIWDLPVYPAAGLFPMLDDEALVALSQDIAQHGLRHPLVVWRGQLLDGRNRREACRLSEVAPEVITFAGDETAALAFVTSVNLRRRHLPASQAALIAAQLLGSAQAPTPAQGGKRAAAVAEAAGVSTRSVEHGVRVVELGAPELVDAVRSGAVPVHTAAALASLPQAEQVAAIATADPKAIKAAAKAIQRQEAGEKRAKQDARRLEAVKAARLTLPSVELCDLRLGRVEEAVLELVGGNATLISADVPWSYSNTGVNGATDKHYGEHGTPEHFADIMFRLGVVAATDAYLLWWVTNPMLGEWMAARERACAQGKSGGWRYLTMITWAKDGRGIGFHAIGDTEHCILYARGNPRVYGPVPSTLQCFPRGEAEEKPVELQQRLVDAYSAPGAAVLDLYAGRASLGEACLREGRRYMGVEAAEDRHQLGLIRLAGVGPDPRQLTIDDALTGGAA